MEKDIIGRNEIDKLVGLDRAPYTIDDIIFYCSKKAISQAVVEDVVLNEKTRYTPADIVTIARNNYIDRSVVEALYWEGLDFSSSHVTELIGLNVFTKPEVLYTYTINDGDSETSVGNRDGMIQVREGVDFTFVIKNNSVFDLDDVTVEIASPNREIDVFKNRKLFRKIGAGETVNITSSLGIKPEFGTGSFTIDLDVADPFFGGLLTVEEQIPVGRQVGESVLALNKQVVAAKRVKVLSGASEKMPELGVLSEGAVFDAVGELGNFYKVKVFGDFGWVKKDDVVDFSERSGTTYSAQTEWEKELRDKALAEMERIQRETAEKVAQSNRSEAPLVERTFVNKKPELFIITPENNDEVYNRVALELKAVDRNYGIESIDIRG